MVTEWVAELTARLAPWLVAEARHGGELLIRMLVEHAAAKLGVADLRRLDDAGRGQVEARVATAIRCLGGDTITPAVLGQLRADIATANDTTERDAPRWAAALRCVGSLDAELDKHYGPTPAPA